MSFFSPVFPTPTQAMDTDTRMDIDVYPPAELTPRQTAQRARRLRERGQPVVADVPKALRPLHPNLRRHDLGPRDIQYMVTRVFEQVWQASLKRGTALG
jgi:hypothetical protein